MARVVEGLALVAIGIAGVFLGPELYILFNLGSLITLPLAEAAIAVGASLTLSGIAQALQANPSLPFSVRQPAAPRVCAYGQVRRLGTLIHVPPVKGDRL